MRRWSGASAHIVLSHDQCGGHSVRFVTLELPGCASTSVCYRQQYGIVMWFPSKIGQLQSLKPRTLYMHNHLLTPVLFNTPTVRSGQKDPLTDELPPPQRPRPEFRRPWEVIASPFPAHFILDLNTWIIPIGRAHIFPASIILAFDKITNIYAHNNCALHYSRERVFFH